MLKIFCLIRTTNKMYEILNDANYWLPEIFKLLNRAHPTWVDQEIANALFYLLRDIRNVLTEIKK